MICANTVHDVFLYMSVPYKNLAILDENCSL